jgi:flagellin
MAMSIRTNLAAMSATSTLSKTQNSLGSSLEKISSGLRINRAADDAAGLGVATRMEADNTSLKQAMRNTNDGISLVQTAEGSIEQLTNILIRFRELSVQAANETYTSTDRGMIGTEMTQLKNEYQRITTLANFNEQSLLNGSGTLSIQVGIDGTSNDAIGINMSNLATTLGAITSLSTVFQSVTTGGAAGASSAATATANLGRLDTAINALSTRRATLGSLQNRFENALSESATYSQNLSAAQSQILDVDYASESANMTRYQIQSQAGVAALAQAKSIPQSIISLLS